MQLHSLCAAVSLPEGGAFRLEWPETALVYTQSENCSTTRMLPWTGTVFGDFQLSCYCKRLHSRVLGIAGEKASQSGSYKTRVESSSEKYSFEVPVTLNSQEMTMASAQPPSLTKLKRLLTLGVHAQRELQ